MLEPRVSRLVLSGRGHGTALLSSAADRTQRAQVSVAGNDSARVMSYDMKGRLVRVDSSDAETVEVIVLARGFTLVRR
ncbi:MAG: hypothetical protein H0V49_04070 [Nocardioidaceae bacterium]|nr:hypothetical protein [Nocardioidaceae bacterium]